MQRWERAGRLSEPILRAILMGVWSGAELPEEAVSREEWIAWFRRAGFLTDCRVTQPTKPRRVFRGCAPDRVRRMSWTSSVKTARWFANYRYDRYVESGPKGSVFSATVQPDGVLAIIRKQRPSELEVVINPAYLSGIERICGA